MIYWILFYLIGFLLCFYLLGSDFFRYHYKIDVGLSGRVLASLLSWILAVVILLGLWDFVSLLYCKGKIDKDLYCESVCKSSKKKKSFKKIRARQRKLRS